MSWGPREPRFDVCWMAEDAEPDGEYFEQVVDFDEDALYRGADVSWVGMPGAMMKVPRDMVVSTPGNPFNPGHLAFLTNLARRGAIFEAPAARIHATNQTAPSTPD